MCRVPARVSLPLFNALWTPASTALGGTGLNCSEVRCDATLAEVAHATASKWEQTRFHSTQCGDSDKFFPCLREITFLLSRIRQNGPTITCRSSFLASPRQLSCTRWWFCLGQRSILRKRRGPWAPRLWSSHRCLTTPSEWRSAAALVSEATRIPPPCALPPSAECCTRQSALPATTHRRN